ncbi:TPA: restriction endonuclease subunit S [Vibrio alginolyticus]|uniref:restriction endonuclease subunit S n=1 Tax=Vibrio alginolyticus TaxID=663 RepID=UPI00215B85AB|nr:restriction endonuclease subunit S [Vibrio alginolyticus]MCR9600853.1 restriction endonuclease subunit S [Vibrio alginolyticus]MCR9604131.1 restriction endonuclease subunit S [Vibrio alginolyticus]
MPASWQLVPLKYICSGFVKDGPHETPKFTDDGIPFLSVDGIQDNKLVFNGCRYISEEDHVRYSMKCHPKQGDVLLGKAASVGKVAYVDSNMDFNVWSPLAVITAKSNKYGKYIYYCLQSSMLQAQCEVFANSNTQKNLGMNTIDNLDMPLPSEHEADVITNFLDHETAKIDTLIEKQQQLIKLLKEKRQAVISHAVTKGLNPEAPMTDSGVEWLGEVPEHWGVGRLGYYSRVINGSTPSKVNQSYWDKREVPWLSSGSVNQYNITTASDYISEKALKECSVELLPVGTLVMGMIGQGKTRGMSAITHIEATINQNLAAIIPDNRLDSEYGHLVLQAAYNEIRECARGGNQAALNCELISNFKVTVPPIDEQKQIVVDTNAKLNRFDQIIKKTMDFVEHSQERRTALISAAVTGKIDVRNWQAPISQDQALEQTA